MGTTERSGLWWFLGALKRHDNFPVFCAAVDWVRKGSYQIAWSVPSTSSCSCSHAYGRGTAVGPQTGARCWPLLFRMWRAIAPLVKPWCAEGEVPTAAKLNQNRGWKSRLGWHCDDEPLFGRSGVEKLNVSGSFGTQALFKWKGKSCPDGEACLCWLGHGDVLVMDGQCQDEFLHCTDPGLEQERINVTFRWIRQHVVFCPFSRTGVACCLPTCAQDSSVAVTEFVGKSAFWVFWVLLGILCIWEEGEGVLALLVFFSSCLQDSGYGGVPIAGHALEAEVGVGIICVTLGELSGMHKNVQYG